MSRGGQWVETEVGSFGPASVQASRTGGWVDITTDVVSIGGSSISQGSTVYYYRPDIGVKGDNEMSDDSRKLFKVIIVDPVEEQVIFEDLIIAGSNRSAEIKAARFLEDGRDPDRLDFYSEKLMTLSSPPTD